MAFFGQNACGAWINFNGTGTIATRDSYNVSSITDHATGTYTVSFTSNFTNDDFCAVITAGGTSGIPTTKSAISGEDFGVGSVKFQTLSVINSGGSMDNSTVCIAAFGDLA